MQIKHRLLTEYARMWPREVFDCLVPNGNRKQALVKVKGLEILEEPGVYVLYRDDVFYYIGQAGKLRKRLWHHAEKPDSRYYQFWNYFSVFVVEDAKNRDEIEGNSDRRHADSERLEAENEETKVSGTGKDIGTRHKTKSRKPSRRVTQLCTPELGSRLARKWDRQVE
ncbi:MAG TPA: hypothetical protein VIH76_07210 [Candidatus Acidoferrales bacterium]